MKTNQHSESVDCTDKNKIVLTSKQLLIIDIVMFTIGFAFAMYLLCKMSTAWMI